MERKNHFVLFKRRIYEVLVAVRECRDFSFLYALQFIFDIEKYKHWFCVSLPAPPDVSTYQYEETSGYYYDPLTTLYYDANSQYYYNAQTGQFMYWDAEKSTYLPAPSNQIPGAEGEVPTDKKRKEDKKEKSKMAKKIAKVRCSGFCEAQQHLVMSFCIYFVLQSWCTCIPLLMMPSQLLVMVSL